MVTVLFIIKKRNWREIFASFIDHLNAIVECGNLPGSYVQSPIGQVWPMSDYIDLHLLYFFFFQAYSVYDEEIGYCQGQSFLAAVLLLHVSIRFLL